MTIAEMIEELKRELERGAREHEATMARLKAERRELLRGEVSRQLGTAVWGNITEPDVALIEAVYAAFMPDDGEWIRETVRAAWAKAKSGR